MRRIAHRRQSIDVAEAKHTTQAIQRSSYILHRLMIGAGPNEAVQAYAYLQLNPRQLQDRVLRASLRPAPPDRGNLTRATAPQGQATADELLQASKASPRLTQHWEPGPARE
jgi:hypothetical protein